jgi:hypothetical protein
MHKGVASAYMFARSISIVAPATLCLVSAFGVYTQSPLSLSGPSTVKAPPGEISVRDNFPIVSQPERPQGMSRSDRKLIEPDTEDVEKFRVLLSKDGYGIAKILNVSCGAESPMVINVSGCADAIPGHGADFSFRNGEHSYPDLSDIKLTGNRLVAGSVMTQGLLVSLGKVDISTFDMSAAEMKYLREFIPAADWAGAKRQTESLMNGVYDNGRLYSAVADVAENRAYAIRSIAYRTRSDGGDRRRDVTLVFTIVRIDADGNITLVWKRLQEKESPKLPDVRDRRL